MLSWSFSLYQMHRIYFIIIAILFYSCVSKMKKEPCIYTRDKLLKNFNNALLDSENYPNDSLLEVWDKGSSNDVRGIYKFNSAGILRFYAFLLSDSNEYNFSRTYDTTGNIVEKTGNDVVQWYFRKLQGDSIKLTFYLFGLDQSYSDLQLKLASDDLKEIKVFQSPIFSNILAGSIICDRASLDTEWIYLTGKRHNKCLNTDEKFADSAEVPAEVK
jgi:hypothetical protein